jgi:hypothetical protein
MMNLPPSISNSEPSWWVKVVEFLQQNWALPVSIEGGFALLFVEDNARVFDRIDFQDERKMFEALRRNEFEEFAKTPRFQKFLRAPEFPLSTRKHPNGRIYSSGRFWRS